MYLTAKIDGSKFHRNGNINSYINSYMSTSEKTELTTSTRYIERFYKKWLLETFSMVSKCGTSKLLELKQINAVTAFLQTTFAKILNLFALRIKTQIIKIKFSARSLQKPKNS